MTAERDVKYVAEQCQGRAVELVLRIENNFCVRAGASVSDALPTDLALNGKRTDCITGREIQREQGICVVRPALGFGANEDQPLTPSRRFHHGSACDSDLRGDIFSARSSYGVVEIEVVNRRSEILLPQLSIGILIHVVRIEGVHAIVFGGQDRHGLAAAIGTFCT
jgi:hypothetical protein